MNYTAEDFAWAQSQLRNYLREDEPDGKHRRMAAIVSAALATASRVAEPGVIERGYMESGGTVHAIADAIRTALQKDKADGV